MTLAIACERLLYCGRFNEVSVNASGVVRLVLKTDTFAVDVLPALGGKVASMRKNGIELLQQPLLPYAPRTLTTAFEDSDASGFDECLPSVSACEIETPSGKVDVPDHGEFWRLPCEVQSQTQHEIRLASIGTVLPLSFERRLRIESDSLHAGVDTLHIDYKVENVGRTDLHYAWSAHPLFAVDPGDRVVLPPSVSQVMVEGSARNRLGSKGAIHSWPNGRLASGETVALDHVGNVSDDIGDKVYVSAPPEGWCAIARTGIDTHGGLRVQVEFDPALSPFLGLWICYGGWPEGRTKRQYCVALEPCTAPVDSLASAMESGQARMLAPGQCDLWWMRIVTTVVS
jgi:galactose mutarotase-like enzyme